MQGGIVAVSFDAPPPTGATIAFDRVCAFRVRSTCFFADSLELASKNLSTAANANHSGQPQQGRSVAHLPLVGGLQAVVLEAVHGLDVGDVGGDGRGVLNDH